MDIDAITLMSTIKLVAGDVTLHSNDDATKSPRAYLNRYMKSHADIYWGMFH